MKAPLWTLVVIGLSACAPVTVEPEGGSVEDAAQPEDAQLDVTLPDVAVPDAATDSTVPDSTVPDSAPDVATCDASTCGALCVDLTTDVEHCGSCSNDCRTLAGVDGTKVRCTSSVCDLTGACLAGLAHCTSDPSLGCETDLTSTASCGACGVQCVVQNGAPSCTQGGCGVASCSSGFADCDQQYSTGCEIDVTSDVANCGSCGNACALAHATATCTSGACAVASCDSGFADCDKQASNGCETDMQTDASNCGACGHACGAGQLCTNGTCTGCASNEMWCPSSSSCVSSCATCSGNYYGCAATHQCTSSCFTACSYSFSCETTNTCVTNCSQQCSNMYRAYANCYEYGTCTSGAGGVSDSCSVCASHHVCVGLTQMYCVPQCSSCGGSYCSP